VAFISGKKTLRGKEQKLVVHQLEKVSEMEMGLDTITNVVDFEQLWVSFSNTIDKTKRREDVSYKDLKLAMSLATLKPLSRHNFRD
jgi:hypothetical protein